MTNNVFHRLFTAAAAALLVLPAFSQSVPADCRWLDANRLALQDHNGVFTHTVDVRTGKLTPMTTTVSMEVEEGTGLGDPTLQNWTESPDGAWAAYTRDGNLYTYRKADGEVFQRTFDGSATVYNGWASWVYYEEIFGRPSQYRAFWWSPDSRKLAFYRFDDTEVPMFPIYSPFGQDGTLRETHYPKAGERNPEVRIAFLDLESGALTWADFDPAQDQYFGTPFWRDDSSVLYVPWEPRIQNTLELFAVNPADGSKQSIYHEEVGTWLNWPEDMLFTDKGLYMVRDFETLWQQIYFLSYDGKTFRRLTDGDNWRISLLRAEKDGSVYFTAERNSHVRSTLYKVSSGGKITALTDPDLHVQKVSISPDGKHFAAWLSSLSTPMQFWTAETRRGQLGKGAWKLAGEDPSDYDDDTLGHIVTMTTSDGLELPGVMYLPENFDPTKQYPVHVDIYGGPDTPMVYDRWVSPRRYAWFTAHGIIELVADCRAAGHNGREGLDRIYKHLNTVEVQDFIEWAKYLQSLPFVKGDKIGVEGFSFGGTMTTMLLLTASDYYHYGIAGGGVYDWNLYDSHYTERFMSTPRDNPEGYRDSRVIGHVDAYPVRADRPADGSVMLKLTHGTGDDNVHFQNTLQLIDALQRVPATFELMIYPDGMHGYRGAQGYHSALTDYAFWTKYLLGE